MSTKGRGSSAVLVGPGGAGYAFDLHTVGGHQLLNAAAAVITLHVLGQDCGQAVEQLRYFDGVVRRMTPAFEAGDVQVYDSYTHHPDEVRADLAAARSKRDSPRSTGAGTSNRMRRTNQKSRRRRSGFANVQL